METELNLQELEKAEQIAALLLKQLRQEITDEELNRLNAWVAKDPSCKQVYDQINNEEQLLAGLQSFKQVDKNALWKKISEQTVVPVKLPVPFFRRPVTWFAAAMVLIVAGIVYSMVVFHKPPKGTNEKYTPAISNIMPGGNKATLTLSNGSVINLGVAANGTVAEEGSAMVVKLKDGELKYEQTGKEPSAGNYNMLSTPRGGQYHLVLPDGSRVWLNAASSITFPTRFAHSERRVAITGEVYFDVSPLPASPGRAFGKPTATEGGGGENPKEGSGKVPFIVSINTATGEAVAEVEVVGTQFNVNAYGDEDAIKTTLLNGKVKISVRHHTDTDPGNREHRRKNARLLLPGQQAQIRIASTGMPVVDSIRVIDQADTEMAVAWKNGFHSFKNADIKTIMRMLGRWYNVDVTYEGNIPSYKFTGSIPRSEKMPAVLHMLEYAGIHFRLQDNKIVVVP